jgi:hypothetical protein
MRFVVVAVALVLLSVQAHAQMGGGGKHHGGGAAADPQDQERQKRRDKEEAAAKAAMKNVPDSKEKYDPWKIGK